jgi:hypothetical protein
MERLRGTNEWVAPVMTTLALFTVAVLVLVSATPASPAASKQRVVLEAKKTYGPGGGTFVVTTLGPGPLTSDSGEFTFRASPKNVVRSGQSIIVFSTTTSFTGKRGTLVFRGPFDQVAAGNGYRVATGDWSIVTARGTGQYAGLSGSGRSAYVVTPQGRLFTRWEGFVTKR